MRIDQMFRAIRNFGIEIAVACVLFFVIAVPAILLDWFVRWLPQHGVSNGIIDGLKWLEMGIFILDVVLCAAFLVRSAHKMMREIWAN